MSEQQQRITSNPKYPNDPDQTMWLTMTKNGNRSAFNHIVRNTNSPFTTFVIVCSKMGLRLKMLPKKSSCGLISSSIPTLKGISFQPGFFQSPHTTASTG